MGSINTPWTIQSSESTPWATSGPNSTGWQKENLHPAQGYILQQDGTSHMLLQNGSDKLELE